MNTFNHSSALSLLPSQNFQKQDEIQTQSKYNLQYLEQSETGEREEGSHAWA